MKDNYSLLKEELADKTAQLIVVSKYRPIEQLQAIYDRGQRLFGENRVQEITDKYEQLPKDIAWHFIGHLQTNKVKYIINFVDTIHSIDSWKLLETVQKEAVKNNREIKVLLQFKIAQEESKYGLTIEDMANFNPSLFPNIKFCGVMGMASFVEDRNQIRSEFKSLYNIYNSLKTSIFVDDSNFKEISMGMSGDYKIAIEEGSTMLRVGSLVFS